MIPCCGHFLVANDALTDVYVDSCPYGTDWTVEQVSGGVKITTNSGKKTFIPMEEYRREVYCFADKVETFYQQALPKKPYDEFMQRGYTAFWNEWKRRRAE